MLEGTYAAYEEIFVEDTRPPIEGLKNTLQIQASWDPKAAKAKVDDFVNLRFVNEMKQNGFLAQLYGQQKMSGR